MMGAASGVHNAKVLFFGGGSPMDASVINNDVTQFDIKEKRWETLFHVEGNQRSYGNEAGVNFPAKRQGTRGICYEGKFYIFGGRVFTGMRNPNEMDEDEGQFKGCKNDLWSFDIAAKKWNKEETTGEKPQPRVW